MWVARERKEKQGFHQDCNEYILFICSRLMYRQLQQSTQMGTRTRIDRSTDIADKWLQQWSGTRRILKCPSMLEDVEDIRQKKRGCGEVRERERDDIINMSSSYIPCSYCVMWLGVCAVRVRVCSNGGGRGVVGRRCMLLCSHVLFLRSYEGRVQRALLNRQE